MAVKLRLRREGTKKAPFYRVVAADGRSPRDGRFIEIVGVYRPLEDPSGIEIDEEKALKWLRNGAQPTDAVLQLLHITGVWEKFHPGEGPVRSRDLQRTKRGRKAKAAAAAAEGGA